MKDKNFLMCGAVNANDDLGGLTRYKSLVAKFDTNANIIWSKTYDTLSPFTGIGHMHETSNGDILLVGSIDTLINYNIQGPTKMKLYKIDSNGGLKWERYFGSAYTYTDSEYARSMNRTNDGGLILAINLVKSPSTPPRPYSIVKIDSTGCDTLEAHCKLIDALGLSDLYKVRGYDMDVFPNPAKGFVNVKVGGDQNKVFKLKLRDAAGREMFLSEIEGEESFVLNTSEFSPGVYFVSLEQNQKVIQNRKLVIIK
ncbi:MAG: T9SS type A sorting domain-containing protein [Bacteroidia bacterium]|nr:T9SS type A sorting domain-containing protein [Bacteroidia bacterium]